MKRNVQKMVALLAVLLLPFLLFSQEYGNILTESFESGIPQTWKEEKVSGDISWVVENDGVRPTGAFDGTKRVAFRNTTNVTTKAKTRLMLPPMDISGLYQPILVFAHAQDKWTYDVDVLKVLYRTSPDAEWTELKVFDQCTSKWQVDTVRLIGANKTYEIAFEAIDNLGRGVVIDNVQVRSTPNCLLPYDFVVTDISNNAVTLNWLGSFDAESFSIKVSSTELTDEQLNNPALKADMLDVVVSDVWNYRVEGLEQGKTYYYYIQSNCETEASGWASSTFETANFMKLPYFEGFVSEPTPGFVTYPKGWYLESGSDVVKAYVNSGNTAERTYTSVDATFALCFNGTRNTMGYAAIPQKGYSLAVMPQIDLPSLDVLQVSFWAIRYYPKHSQRFSIIVGVMSDPKNKSSFTPVDTVDITEMQEHVESVVSLEKYKGSGKYIAFLSEFEETNIFVMDNVKVDYRPEVAKASFHVGIPSSTSFKLEFDQQYDSYDVVVATSEFDDVTKLETATDVVRATIANGGLVEGINAETEYYVYARAIKGTSKGEWSNVKRVRTPGKATSYPYLIDFELDLEDPTTYYSSRQGVNIHNTYKLVPEVIFHTDYTNLPQCLTTYWTQTSAKVPARTPYELNMISSVADYSWVTTVMSEMIDPKQTFVSFYATAHVASAGSKFYVGVMSDANDPSTFVAIDTIEAEMGYGVYGYDLANYKVDGKFFAFSINRADYVNVKENSIFIDDVRYEKRPECNTPTNIEVKTSPNDPSKITITWDANGATQWNVRFADTEYNRDSLYVEGLNYEYLYNATVGTNSVEISGLRFPNVYYYFWIQPLCEGNKGDWTVAQRYSTECYDVHPLPYYENFDNPSYVAATNLREFPVPCMYTKQVSYSTSFYPYLTTNQSVEKNGKSLYLSKSASWSPSGVNTYVALPKMAAPIKDLELTFKMYVTDTKFTLDIGVLEDPLDSTTFDVVTTIKPKFTNEFVEYTVAFENYTGKGEYIAFMTNYSNTTPVFYVDEIKVDHKSSCIRPSDVALVDVSNTTATLGWTKSSVTSWRVMITNRRLTVAELASPLEVNETILSIDTVTTNPAVISDLAENSPYFAYVQSMCESLSAWSNPLPFRTSCVVRNVGELGVEHFDDYGAGNGTYPPCFIVGNIAKPTTLANIPQCNTTYKRSGAASLQFKTTTAANGAYAITSRLDISDISMLRVKFWASTGTADAESKDFAHSIIVGVVTDPTDLGTFVSLDTVEVVYESLPYEVCLDSYKYDYNGDKGKYVMFLSNFDKQNTVFIDDLEFDTIPSCLTQFEVENITPTSIDVKFLAENVPFQLKYATSMCSVEELDKDSLPVVNVTTGNTVTITGLKASTTYYLYARSTCGSSMSDWSVVEAVRTSCLELLSLPYSYGFDDQVVTGYQPSCWHSYYSANTKFPQLNAQYINSGSRSIYLYTASATYQSYLVSPEVDIDDLSKCQVTFFSRNNMAGVDRSVVVGVVSNLDSIVQTFVPVDTLLIYQPTLKFEEQKVLLDSYVGNGKYIAFYSSYVANGSSGGGVYIDDITIELIPVCAKPTACKLVTFTDNSITVAYEHDAAVKYEVKYGSVGFDPTTAGTVVESTEKVIKITSLNSETEYDVYVRAYCNEVDASPWTSIGTFKTASVPFSSFPYVNDFSDVTENSKWLFKQQDQPNQWYIGTDEANMVTDGINNGGKALYISKDGGRSAQYRSDLDDYTNMAATSSSWAYRTIALEPGVYTISYDWTCHGQATHDYMRVGLIPVTEEFNSGSANIWSSDGSFVTFTYTTASYPKGWIELSESVISGSNTLYKNNLIDTTQTLEREWKSYRKLVVITPDIAGVYNFVVYWKNDASIGQYAHVRSAVVDNISIIKEACAQPMNVRHTDYTSSTIDVAWEPISGNPMGYEAILSTEENVAPAYLTAEQIAARQVVDTKSVHFTGLAESTIYYCYVRSICAVGDTGLWAGPVLVRTDCSPQPLDIVYNFDDDKACYMPQYTNGATQTTYKVPNCFVNSHETLEFTSSTAQYFPYMLKNTSSALYSRSGNYCLRLYRTTKRQAGGIIALPMIDGNMEELQVSFWMRCVHNNASGKLTVTGLGATYDRSVEVGTMTDPYDPSTFEPLGLFVYPYKNGELTSQKYTKDDPDGEGYWVECTLPLSGATGKYVAFRNSTADDFAPYNLVYIDDVKVSSLTCVTPSGVEFSSVKANSVVVNAKTKGASKYVIQIADNNQFENARFDTVASLPATISNLANGTKYFVKIQSICSAEDVSGWSALVSFSTLTSLSYTQDFEQASYRPETWWQASDPQIDAYFGGGLNFTESPVTTFSGWASKPALFSEGLFSTRHIRVPVVASDNFWLFSPKFEMPESGKTHLIFDLALTNQNENTPVKAEYLPMIDDRFIVVVSEDGGETWSSSNATIWGHDRSADHKFFDIPNTGKQYEIDLTKYAGKVIQIAFYAESRSHYSGAYVDLHLDNVHLNTYIEEAMNLSICQTEDLEHEPFSIHANDLKVGDNQFIHMRQSSKEADTNYKLDVVVTPMVETYLKDIICEGDVYSKHNFSGLEVAGTYKQKLVSSNGCDSVVVLDLTMTAAERTMIFDTICYGNSVVWNGVEYDKSGAYIDTLVSKVTGCDSIVTFVLNVKEILRSTQYVNICHKDTFIFGSQVITESGEYKETFVTSEGCDSLVTLYATVLPDLRQTINATIFEGEQYNDNGFIGLTIGGTYTLPLTSQDGCDSTVTLVLKVIDPTEVALDNIKATDLTLVPNPVKVNNTLYINAEFTSEEAEGLVVEVFNAIGQLVYSETPTLYPIAIEGLAHRGVYMVRITTGGGQIYQGKVIVE